MKKIFILLTFLFLLGITLACQDPLAAEAAQREEEIPQFIKDQWLLEAQETARSEYYEEPDLTGFKLVTESKGLTWDCKDSKVNINGEMKQRIIKVGDYLFFVCKDNIPYFKFVE